MGQTLSCADDGSVSILKYCWTDALHASEKLCESFMDLAALSQLCQASTRYLQRHAQEQVGVGINFSFNAIDQLQVHSLVAEGELSKKSATVGANPAGGRNMGGIPPPNFPITPG